MIGPAPLAPLRARWFGNIMHATIGRLLLLLFRVRIIGVENIPATGAVLAGNHISYGDPVLLWCALSRRVHFMGKSELWKHAIVGWAISHVGAFPVRRGESDREAISNATELLRRGDLVGIFPEGTRNKTGDATVQGGAAFIAMRAGVPIVPVGLAGTDAIMPSGARMIHFPRVTMSCGKPISPEDFPGGRKERVEAMTAETMRRIAEELERARRA